jgi:GNAT superfamily N-acetyltransferase
MSAAILHDLTPSSLVPAMEANFVQWWSFFRHASAATLHEEPEVLWLRSGIPLTEYNGVIRATFAAARTEEEITHTIRRLQAHFAAYQVGMAWFIGPSTTPANLSRLLEAQGFVCWGPGPGMALDLTQLPQGGEVPAGLEIVRVADAAQLADWTMVAALGYAEDASTQAARLSVQAQLGWAADAPLQRYLGVVNGQPVAMSALFLAAGAAGIYEVLTLPPMRGQGIGGAMTRYPLQVARQQGYLIGVLEASPMGLPLYRHLGFQEYCQFLLYAWEPAQEGQKHA